MMEVLPTIFVVLSGLAIGSFLNVVIYRVPRQTMFATARSVCPHCSRQLRWYHNIPVLSFTFLRGKCADCGGRISLRYPLVELLNAAAYAYFWDSLGPGLSFVAMAVLASALLVVFFIDLDFQIIPDWITLPGMAVGLGASLLPGGIGVVDAAIGLVVGGGTLLAVAMLGDWLFKKESMGGGDIKLAAMLGAFLGWQKVLLVFLASAVIGLLVSLALLVVSEKLRRTRVIPFGPFLSMAAMLSIVYGDRIIGYYLTNIVQLP